MKCLIILKLINCFHINEHYFHTHRSQIYVAFLFFTSCGSSGRTAEKTSLSFKSDQVKVKQEPGTEDELCGFSGAVKQEKTEDGRRSACMVKPGSAGLFPRAG